MSDSIEGRVLCGRFRVGTVIGRGGMSVVREAFDLALSRRVAIKMILGAQSRELCERLAREGRAAARTAHPAIVTVYDYGTDEETGLDFLVMEYLEGEDLGARIARQGALPVAKALSIGIEISDALAHVHSVGIVHRDLKPANVFLVQHALRTDAVKVLDFGVARQVDLDTLTLSGQTLGTFAYIAPERLATAKGGDPRSDLYSMGVLLYECVTGSLPYAAHGVEALMHKAWNETFSPPVFADASVPRPLIDIIVRCLQPKPDGRFPSARALCDALLRASEAQPA